MIKYRTREQKGPISGDARQNSESALINLFCKSGLKIPQHASESAQLLPSDDDNFSN